MVRYSTGRLFSSFFFFFLVLFCAIVQSKCFKGNERDYMRWLYVWSGALLESEQFEIVRLES